MDVVNFGVQWHSFTVHAKSIADFKAISLNVMHESMDISDEIYSRLDA
jgi:hypothetical protein